MSRNEEPQRIGDSKISNVVGLLGGLGNQLFQLAMARWLEVHTGQPTRFDLSSFRTRPEYLGLRELGFSLGQTADWTQRLPYPGGRFPRTAHYLRTLAGPRRVRFEHHLGGLPTGSQLDTPAWYYGYWQDPAMVNEVIEGIRSDHEKSKAVAAAPSSQVAMHVRRGDMIGQPGEIGPAYYRAALERITNEHHLASHRPVTVFSDDVEWCRTNLGIQNLNYAPANSAAADLSNLAGFQYLVLSGSTFSWWAAQMRRREANTVVAPFPIIPTAKSPLDIQGWLSVAR